MDINVTQDCTATDPVSSQCTQYHYSGNVSIHDNFQVSIPMLEAMGLITLWIAVAISVAVLIKKFS